MTINERYERASETRDGADRQCRRASDGTTLVRLATSHVAGLPPYHVCEPEGQVSTLHAATFLVDLPGDEVLVLPAEEVSVLVRNDGTGLSERAIAVAAARRQERQRIEQRGRNADWLMAFIDELEAAGQPVDAYRALSTCAANVAGAPAAVVYAGGVTVDALRPVHAHGRTMPLPDLPRSIMRAPVPMRVVSHVAAETDAGSAEQSLAPVFAAFCAAQLLCVPVASDAILMVVERRRDRVFTSDERDMVRWIVSRTERSLSVHRSVAPARPS